METMDIERTSPPPPPLTHRVGSDGEATRDVTPAPGNKTGNVGGGTSTGAEGVPDLDDGTVPSGGAMSATGDTEGDTALDELPGLPGLPDDLGFDEDEQRPATASSSARDELDLPPLPTEFDPDAPVVAWQSEPLPEDDELALRPREELEPPAEEAGQDDLAEDAGVVEHQEHDAEQDVQHPGEEEAGPGFFDLLRTLQGGAEEEAYPAPEDGAGGDEAPPHHGDELPPDTTADDTAMAVDEPADPHRSPSPFASPLTPIPDLPSELPSDSEVPPLPRLPSALAPELKTAPRAESSTAASERARTRSVGSGSPAEPRKRKGKSPAHTSDEQDEEDEGEKRARYQRRKGLDGKPIRASAKPRKRIDAQLGIKRDGDKPPEKVAPRELNTGGIQLTAGARTLTDNKLRDLVMGKTREVQLAPCIRPRYGQWGKCTQCVSKIGGDSCRFRNYRVFPLNPNTGEIIGPGRFESTTLDEPITPQPERFNVRLTEEHVKRTEKTVAPLLVDLISREMRHVVKNNALHRPVDTAKHRSVCDFCASTIFAGFWFCEKCGRDYCIECERFFSDNQEHMSESPWPVPAPARPRLHRCTRGDDDTLPLHNVRMTKPMHFRSNLRAASRFTADELRSNFSALVNYVLEPGASDMDVGARVASLGLGEDEAQLADAVREYLHTTTPAAPPKRPLITDTDIEALYDASRSLPQPADPTDVPPLPFMYIDADRLDDVFDTLWARGEPLVAHNIGKRLKHGWTPDNFLRRFGPEPCYVVDCQSDKSLLSSVGAFFLLFKELGGETKAPQPARVTPSPADAGGNDVRAASPAQAASAAQTASPRQGPDVPVDERPTGAISDNSKDAGSVPPAPKVSEEREPRPADAAEANGNDEPAQQPSQVDKNPTLDSGSAAPTESQGSPPKSNGDAQAPAPANHAPSPAQDAREQPPEANGNAQSFEPSGGAKAPQASDANIAGLSRASPATATPVSAPRSTTPGERGDVARIASAPPVSRNGTPGANSIEQIASLAPGYRKLKEANKIFKLKDWPATDDFASAYPDLYQDFAQALPAPDFTRRIGALNLYAHFPDGPTKPDIGPKMYNAFAGLERKGGFGSTRLHMDVADAVNVMLYATKLDDGSPGCAVWDLFRAEDADKIRAFLRNKFGQARMTDPIHSQLFYLDSELRSALYAEYGVSSFRVYQHPGQAVFIPAGCAHQVCNLAPCMKIALDFVSPHNVRRCQQLMQDFRKENYARVWKDDVLQLYNVMWYAWTNVRAIRDKWKAQAAERQRALLRQAVPAPSSPRPRLLGPAMSSVRDDPAPARDGDELNGAAATGEGDASPTPKEASVSAVTTNGGAGDADKDIAADGADAKGDKATAPGSSGAEDRRASLVQRLMDAAIARPLTPTMVQPAEGKKSKGTRGGSTAPSAPRHDRSSATPQATGAAEFRYSDAIRGGLVPAELAMGVLRSDLGGEGGETTDVPMHEA